MPIQFLLQRDHTGPETLGLGPIGRKTRGRRYLAFDQLGGAYGHERSGHGVEHAEPLNRVTGISCDRK